MKNLACMLGSSYMSSEIRFAIIGVNVNSEDQNQTYFDQHIYQPLYLSEIILEFIGNVI